MKKRKNQKQTITLAHPSYQPSKAELEKDMRVDVTFQELTKAVVSPVTIRHVEKQKRT